MENFILFFGGIALFVLFLDCAIVLYLRDELCATFDAKFKPNIEKSPIGTFGVSRRMSRASWYASCVGGAKNIRGFIRNSADYDFKSKVSKKVYVLCRVHCFCIYVCILTLFPSGIALLIKKYF